MKRIAISALAALLLALPLLAQGIPPANDLGRNQYLEKSLELSALASQAFDAGDYDAAKEYAKEAQDWARRSDEYVAQLQAAALARAAKVLPATYTVRLLPARRDCLWNIAAYPFVYNDPLKWPVLYEANKKGFRDPGNPNLIFPGQVLSIPSIAGEIREGAWDPAKSYEPLSKTGK